MSCARTKCSPPCRTTKRCAMRPSAATACSSCRRSLSDPRRHPDFQKTELPSHSMNTKSLSHAARLVLPGLVAAFAFTGCISTEETVYRDEARMKVEFENDTAARFFYEKLSKSNAGQKTESKTEVSIPVVFDHKHQVVQ